MNAEVAEEALEEGRVALFQLERQLKERDEILNHDNHSEGSTSRQSSILERRLLDKIPRNTRLNNRLESLGLTVEVNRTAILNTELTNTVSFDYYLK